ESLADLAQVAGALHAVRLLASPVQRRQQNGDQQRDDADHDQQLDEGEATLRPTITKLHKEAPFGKCRERTECGPTDRMDEISAGSASWIGTICPTAVMGEGSDP